jgi:hypothetical protein
MFLGIKSRPVRKADNLTAICEPIVWTMWDPQHLTTHGLPLEYLYYLSYVIHSSVYFVG